MKWFVLFSFVISVLCWKFIVRCHILFVPFPAFVCFPPLCAFSVNIFFPISSTAILKLCFPCTLCYFFCFLSHASYMLASGLSSVFGRFCIFPCVFFLSLTFYNFLQSSLFAHSKHNLSTCSHREMSTTK